MRRQRPGGGVGGGDLRIVPFPSRRGTGPDRIVREFSLEGLSLRAKDAVLELIYALQRNGTPDDDDEPPAA